MTKKQLAICVSAVIITGAFCAWWLTGRKSHNKVIVSADNALSANKVRIDKGFYSINSGSDENLVRSGLGKVIYTNNNSRDFEIICGENDFLIVYNNEFYTIIRHFIPNDFKDGIPEPHLYLFDLKKIGGKIHLTLNIDGPEGVKIEKDLVDIAGARNNTWGRRTEQ